MSKSFTDIAFTDSVKAAQSLYGTRELQRRRESSAHKNNELSHYEIAYIGSRDSFYQATVAENGWPYIQHKGGPVGFLKVLDPHTIAYADYSGNKQYLSTGNLTANDKVSLFLVDYPNGIRLKIWGEAKIVHETEDPDLFKVLRDPAYPYKVERAIVIHVDAYDWNCPQHITPRYTQSEIEAILRITKE
jgi:predicted pyridoxine 5'-phosphate oxidase superfamily flavin-nucleotide-binding protein